MLLNALKPTRFSHDVVRKFAVGGGIIPVSQRADGTMCMLLAKEQYVTSWKGSWRWSGFEGRRKPNEMIEETSVREWREESLDSIASVTAADLDSGRFVCRYTLNITHPKSLGARESDADNPERYHVTYLVHVPYDEVYVENFQQRRTKLMEVREADERLKALTFKCTGINKQLNDFTVDEAMCCFYFSNGTCVKIDRPFPSSVVAWMEARTSLGDAVDAALPRDAITVVRNINCEVISAEVVPDYMEKERIAWWSVDDLKYVLRNGGRHGEEHFRTYFLPVLQGLVGFLDGIPLKKE